MTKDCWCYMVEVQIWQRNAGVIWLMYKYDKGLLVLYGWSTNMTKDCWCYMVEVQIWQRTADVIWLKYKYDKGLPMLFDWRKKYLMSLNVWWYWIVLALTRLKCATLESNGIHRLVCIEIFQTRLFNLL